MEGKNLRDSKIEGGLCTRGAFCKKSEPGKPLISIITVVRNGEKYLEQTIQSVLNQTYENIEYIIIDGVSTDGTLDIIRKYEDQIAYWVSEPDGGIYDAMNKGIQLSTGEIIGILNSDDWYLPSAVCQSVQGIQKTGAYFSYGKVYLTKENGLVFGCTSPLNDKEMSERIFKEMPFPHLSVFVTRRLYEKIGVFDNSYGLSADYELFVRAYTKGLKGTDIREFIGFFRTGGRSGGIQTFKESKKIVLKYGKGKVYANIMFYRSLLKVALNKIFPLPLIKMIKKMTKSKHNLLD